MATCLEIRTKINVAFTNHFRKCKCITGQNNKEKHELLNKMACEMVAKILLLGMEAHGKKAESSVSQAYPTYLRKEGNLPTNH